MKNFDLKPTNLFQATQRKEPKTINGERRHGPNDEVREAFHYLGLVIASGFVIWVRRAGVALLSARKKTQGLSCSFQFIELRASI